MIEPIDRKELKSWPILPDDVATARDGDLVRFELVRRGRFATPRAEIVESLGNPDDQRQISLIAIHAHGIPEDFPESVLEECETLPPPTMEGRTDLRACCSSPSILSTRAITTTPCMPQADSDREKLRRLGRDGRHRRRCALHQARLETRSRSAATRQFRLLPRPRRADAAGKNFERPLLAARTRRAALPRGAHGLRSARRKAQPHIRARHDEIGGQALVPGSAGGDRRNAVRQVRAAARQRAEAALGGLQDGCQRHATSAGRSTSICPSARSCSTTKAESNAS